MPSRLFRVARPRTGLRASAAATCLLLLAALAAAQAPPHLAPTPARPTPFVSAHPAAAAQAPSPAATPTPPPSAQQLAAGHALFAKVVDAHGGETKARTVKDVQTRGQVTAKTPEGEMTMEIQTAMIFPDRLSQQIDARHVLFISGYDQEALVEGDAAFLQKPFSRDELTRAVRAQFDGARVVTASYAA